MKNDDIKKEAIVNILYKAISFRSNHCDDCLKMEYLVEAAIKLIKTDNIKDFSEYDIPKLEKKAWEYSEEYISPKY